MRYVPCARVGAAVARIGLSALGSVVILLAAPAAGTYGKSPQPGRSAELPFSAALQIPTYVSDGVPAFEETATACPAEQSAENDNQHSQMGTTCGLLSGGQSSAQSVGGTSRNPGSDSVAPAVENEAGDILEIQQARPGALYKKEGGFWTSCALTIPYVGSSYATCAYVYAYDSVLKSSKEIPMTNSEENAEYDACGTEVSSGSGSGWHFVGHEWWNSGWTTGPIATVPTSEPAECLGTWSMHRSFTQKFTDGETLTDTIIAPFTVTELPVPPSATWGGGNPTELPCIQTCGGDPVNTFSGDYSESTTDIAIPGRGPELAMTRTYSSLAAHAKRSSVLGRGWEFPYGLSLSVESGKGYVTITNANGSQTQFQPGVGGFVAPPRVLATLVENKDGTYTYTVKERTIYTFNSSGKLTTIADLNGNETTLSYNESGQLQSVTDSAGRSLTFSYNESGKIASVADSTGRKVGYGYNGAGYLDEVTDVRGGTSHYTYDEEGLLLTYEDPRENVVLTNTYNSAGQVLTQTDGREDETTYSYSTTESTKTTDETNPRGYVTEYEYVNGILSKRTEAKSTESSATWTYEHDPYTLGVTAATDPNGHTMYATYDSGGNKIATKDALGNETSSKYDSLDDLIEYTDADGVTTTYEYDEKGNLLSSSTPLVGSTDSRTISYAYESKTHPEDVTSMTDPNGKTTTYTYDAVGDLASSTDAAGDKTTYTYDELGRRLTMVSPRGNAKGSKSSEYTTSYSYNAAGNRLTETDPLGHEQKWVYDANGNVKEEEDPQKHVTTYEYDAANRVVKVTRPNGDTTETGFDADGNVVSRTDGLEHATTYSYDPLDHLASSRDPLERETTFVYDGVGNLMKKTDADKRTTSYSYDADNRPMKVSYSDETTPSVEYGYDKEGRRISMNDGSGESTFEYDSLGRLAETTNGYGDTSSYGYDLAGNETSIVYPNGKAVTRGFDEAERLSSVTDWLGNTTSFSYDANSNLKTTSFPKASGNADEFAYDRANRMSEVKMKKSKETLASVVYVRDKAGQLESLTSKGLPGAESEAFSYDTNSRLTKAGSANYEYDAADDLTKAPGTTNTYDKASELEKGTAVTYGYDNEGERAEAIPESGPTTAYSYDQAGNLIGVERPEEGKTSAINEAYAYDGSGLRVSETVSGATHHLTWNESAGVPLLLSDEQASYIYGPDGLPVEQIAKEVPTYYHHDQLGSTRILTSESGKVTGTFSYSAYGAPSGSTGTQTTPLGYAGQYTSAQSGLQYLRSRNYDPATGQFLTRDSLGVVAGAPYGYANENPLQFVDPAGTCGIGSIGEAIESINPFSEENCAYQAAKEAIEFFGGHAADIAAVTGIAAVALSFTPAAPLAAALGAISSAASAYAAGEEAAKGEALAAALDGLGAVLGGTAAAERFLSALESLAPTLGGKSAADQASALADLLDKLGYTTLAASILNSNALCTP